MFIKNILLLIALILLVSQAHAKNKFKVTENRIKVAILDTGISYKQAKSEALCKGGRVNFTRGPNPDYHGHGTNIFGIIEKKINSKTHCIIAIKVWKKGLNEKQEIEYTIKGFKLALERDVKFINFSMGGAGNYSRELSLIKRAIRKGITIVVAAGNGDADGKGIDLDKNCTYFPACYKPQFPSDKFRVVTTYSLKSSNRGKVVTDTALGRNVEGGGLTFSGTSQATAIITSRLINKKSK